MSRHRRKRRYRIRRTTRLRAAITRALDQMIVAVARNMGAVRPSDAPLADARVHLEHRTKNQDVFVGVDHGVDDASIVATGHADKVHITMRLVDPPKAPPKPGSPHDAKGLERAAKKRERRGRAPDARG